ncbi:hypothetical protein DFH27DRAFT_523736 [Peziza echinospora]|nr:hypothetical protein DFH27DRAFT_523736 [Peziza echinospora]
MSSEAGTSTNIEAPPVNCGRWKPFHLRILRGRGLDLGMSTCPPPPPPVGRAPSEFDFRKTFKFETLEELTKYTFSPHLEATPPSPLAATPENWNPAWVELKNETLVELKPYFDHFSDETREKLLNHYQHRFKLARGFSPPNSGAHAQHTFLQLTSSKGKAAENTVISHSSSCQTPLEEGASVQGFTHVRDCEALHNNLVTMLRKAQTINNQMYACIKDYIARRKDIQASTFKKLRQVHHLIYLIEQDYEKVVAQNFALERRKAKLEDEVERLEKNHKAGIEVIKQLYDMVSGSEKTIDQLKGKVATESFKEWMYKNAQSSNFCLLTQAQKELTELLETCKMEDNWEGLPVLLEVYQERMARYRTHAVLNAEEYHENGKESPVTAESGSGGGIAETSDSGSNYESASNFEGETGDTAENEGNGDKGNDEPHDNTQLVPTTEITRPTTTAYETYIPARKTSDTGEIIIKGVNYIDWIINVPELTETCPKDYEDLRWELNEMWDIFRQLSDMPSTAVHELVKKVRNKHLSGGLANAEVNYIGILFESCRGLCLHSAAEKIMMEEALEKETPISPSGDEVNSFEKKSKIPDIDCERCRKVCEREIPRRLFQRVIAFGDGKTCPAIAHLQKMRIKGKIPTKAEGSEVETVDQEVQTTLPEDTEDVQKATMSEGHQDGQQATEMEESSYRNLARLTMEIDSTLHGENKARLRADLDANNERWIATLGNRLQKEMSDMKDEISAGRRKLNDCLKRLRDSKKENKILLSRLRMAETRQPTSPAQRRNLALRMQFDISSPTAAEELDHPETVSQAQPATHSEAAQTAGGNMHGHPTTPVTSPNSQYVRPEPPFQRLLSNGVPLAPLPDRGPHTSGPPTPIPSSGEEIARAEQEVDFDQVVPAQGNALMVRLCKIETYIAQSHLANARKEIEQWKERARKAEAKANGIVEPFRKELDSKEERIKTLEKTLEAAENKTIGEIGGTCEYAALKSELKEKTKLAEDLQQKLYIVNFANENLESRNSALSKELGMLNELCSQVMDTSERQAREICFLKAERQTNEWTTFDKSMKKVRPEEVESKKDEQMKAAARYFPGSLEPRAPRPQSPIRQHNPFSQGASSSRSPYGSYTATRYPIKLKPIGQGIGQSHPGDGQPTPSHPPPPRPHPRPKSPPPTPLIPGSCSAKSVSPRPTFSPQKLPTRSLDKLLEPTNAEQEEQEEQEFISPSAPLSPVMSGQITPCSTRSGQSDLEDVQLASLDWGLSAAAAGYEPLPHTPTPSIFGEPNTGDELGSEDLAFVLQAATMEEGLCEILRGFHIDDGITSQSSSLVGNSDEVERYMHTWPEYLFCEDDFDGTGGNGEKVEEQEDSKPVD